MHKEVPCIGIYAAVQVNVVQHDIKGLLAIKYVFCSFQLEGSRLAVPAGDIREVHGAVGLHGNDARRLAAVGQAHGAGADCANVIDGDRYGKLLLTSYNVRAYRAGRDKQLRLFDFLLWQRRIGVGRIVPICNGHMDGKRLLGLRAEYIQIIGLECDRIGAVDSIFDQRYLKYEYICAPTVRRLGIISEYEGAVCSSAKVGGDGDLAVIRIAQQWQYDVYYSIHHPRHIAFCVGSVHAVI